jgi:hypothetical protein
MLARALSLIMAMSLGACSVSGLLPDWTSADVAGPEPAYRFLIASKIDALIGNPANAGTLEISGVRRINSLKGASWVACIKMQKFPLPPTYRAILFQGGLIVDSRLSVLIDQCEIQSYRPFDWQAEAKNAPL